MGERWKFYPSQKDETEAISQVWSQKRRKWDGGPSQELLQHSEIPGRFNFQGRREQRSAPWVTK